MVSLIFAILLPWALGTSLWAAILGRPRNLAAWLACIGAGFVIGFVVLGAGLLPLRATPAQDLFRNAAPWVAVALGGTLALAWLRRNTPIRAPAGGTFALSEFALLAMLLLVGSALVVQTVSLPTLGWDAWNAWFAKTRAWYHAGALLPARTIDAWLIDAKGDSIAVAAAHYPEALPRVALWMTSSTGRWQTSAVHLPWAGLWLALGAVLVGYLRLGGARWRTSLLAAAFVLLLPLTTAQVALAGYADLWLASAILIAGMHLMRWFAEGAKRDVVMALSVAALLPMIKLEGSVWTACLALAFAVGSLPQRLRWIALPALLLVWAAGLPFGGWRIPLPGLGSVQLGLDRIVIPGLAPMELSLRPVLEEVLQTLFLLPNWSILWWVAPVVIVLRWRRLRHARGLAAAAWFLACGYAFLFVLFFLTDAAAWAENLTSVNRVLMHIVPLTVAWLTLLWNAPQVPRDTARPSSG